MVGSLDSEAERPYTRVLVPLTSIKVLLYLYSELSAIFASSIRVLIENTEWLNFSLKHVEQYM